jgi:hypothetical protein
VLPRFEPIDLRFDRKPVASAFFDSKFGLPSVVPNWGHGQARPLVVGFGPPNQE